MKQLKKYFPLLMICLIGGALSLAFSSSVWGFWGHKRINRMAVFTLPPEMITFYKENIEYVTEHAIDPDKRRYALKGEAENHYIDIDHYGEYPYEMVPRKWEDAVEKYTEDTLRAYGISPWHLEKAYAALVAAFRQGDKNRILKRSADIGHYIGDIHVPLHTTINYNGQLTDQKGIHGFWESRVPELFGEDYDYFTGRSIYLEDLNSSIWNIILESAAQVDSVLQFELDVSERFPPDKKYVYEDRGNMNMRTYSKEFSKAYQAKLLDMQERKMRKSIIMVGSFWYSAWVDGGQPDLSTLGEINLTDSEKKAQKKLEKAYQQGDIKGRNHWQ